MAAAAYFQGQTSGIRATATAAGQSVRVLDGDVQRLARSFPIGTAGAVALVQSVQGLGVQEGKIRPLAAVIERLSAATSSSGPEMAQNFGQLNRQMASLDPARVGRFADVVTTLSAKTGASAMGLINFAHSIAPVAQQAGIGESAVLGISAAFVKLGDDGGAAATAVNKILSDLNRSVREGSNDMAAYAQITGMTVDRFRQLYQANPAQALTAVTTAIGKAGPQGQMQLESLGLEGVRTQRALLQLSQSGGLQQTINQAVGAYGNDSTQKAAAAALTGLNSSLTELRSTAGQTADALGGPFLHILTKITDIAKVPLGAANAVLGSGYSQNLLGGLATVAVGGMLARRVVRPLALGAIGRQAAISGPARSIFGGYALGRAGGDVEEGAAGGFAGRFGAEPIAMQAFGAPYGRGYMQPVNRFALRAGNIAGQFRYDLSGGAPRMAGGPGLIGSMRRAGAAGVTAASMGYQAYLRTYTDPFVQAQTPAGDRVSLLQPAPGGVFNRAGLARQAEMASAQGEGAGLLSRQYRGLQASLGLIEKQAGGAGPALARMTEATLGATRATLGFTGRLVEASASAAARVGGGALSLVGGVPGAALLGALGVYGIYQHAQSQTNQINSTMRNTDVYGVENSWLDAVGAASKGAMSMADAMASATDTINSAVTNFHAASTVSNADVVAAGKYNAADQRKSAPLNYALGSTSAVQSLVQANALGGMSPQDMQGLKLSMIKQGIPTDRINAILAGVNTAGTGGQLNASTITGITSAYGSAVRSYDRHGHGLLDTDIYAGRDAQKVAQTAASALGQQQSSLTEKFGSRYATQQTVRSLDELMKQLPDAQRYTFSHAIAASPGYRGSGGAFSTKDLLGFKGLSIGGESGQDLVKLLGGATLPAHLQPSILEAPLRSAGASALLPFFTSAQAKGPYRAGQAAAEFVGTGHEADIGAQTKAAQAIVDGSIKAGTSLSDLAVQASKATSATAGWQQQLLQSVSEEAQLRMGIALQGATRAQRLGINITQDRATIAAGPGVDPNGFQAKQYTAARQDLVAQRQSVVDYYQQRVMAQYQFQIQSERAQEDFQRQTSRSEQDFFISRQRAFRDYNIQVQRQAQDAAQQMYNPYQRIQVRPVFDSANLAGNRQEQIGAMRRQIQDIKLLKRLGLSQDAIDQLQLYDPQNAMQADQMLADLSADHSQVTTLNRQASTTLSLSGQLVSQSPTYRRQREDFTKSLRDQQSDFDRQQSRARTDFKISMTRMAQDLHMQDLEITNNMTSLTADMNKILRGQAVDLQSQITGSLKTTLAAVTHYMPLINSGMAPGGGGSGSGGTGTTFNSGINAGGSVSGGGFGNAAVTSSSFSDTIDPRTGRPVRRSGQTTSYVKPGTGSVYSGAMSGTSGAGDADYRPTEAFMNAHPADPNFNRSIAKSMMPRWSRGAEWAAWNALWGQESGWNQYADNDSSDAYGIPQALPGSRMKPTGRDWRTNPATQIKWGIGYIGGRYGDPIGAEAHEKRFGWYGAGSIFTGPQMIGIGERGPEAAIPLNAQGMEFMVAALRQYAGSAKTVNLGGLAHATHVTYTNDTYHYDAGQHIHGPVTVKANSPAEWAASAMETKRRDNLTGARGVRWSKS